MNSPTITNVFGFVIICIIIYVLLRYTNMDGNKSIMYTFIAAITLLALYALYNYYYTETYENCDTCKLPKNNTCRIVCDSTFEPMENTTPHITQVPQVPQVPQMPQVQQVNIPKPPQVAPNQLEEIQKQLQNIQQQLKVVNRPQQSNNNEEWLPKFDNVEKELDKKYGYGAFYNDQYPFAYTTLTNTVVDKAREEREKDIRTTKENEAYYDKVEDKARSVAGYNSAYQPVGSKSQYVTVDAQRGLGIEKLPKNDSYSDYKYSDYNNLPVAEGYKSTDYEYGYSFIPPEKWYPQPVRPPICVADKPSVTYPNITSGYPVDMKTFYSSNAISPPLMINTNYINDRLNQGK